MDATTQKCLFESNDHHLPRVVAHRFTYIWLTNARALTL